MRRAGDAQGGGDHDRLGGSQEGGRADGLTHAFALYGGIGGVAAGEHNEEFLAAITTHRIVAAGSGFQAACGLAEHGIAGQMPAAIVDRLEKVQIGHEDRNRSAVTRGAGEFVVQLFQDAGAIQQTGQAVVRGLFAERFAGFEEFFLQIENAAAGVQADAQFVSVERLRKVIIGAGVHALDQVLRFGARGEQEYIDVGFAVGAANAPADFQAIHPGHHPIQDRKTRSILGLQDAPGFGTATRDDGLIPPLGEHGLQHGLKYRIVLSGQDAHGT